MQTYVFRNPDAVIPGGRGRRTPRAGGAAAGAVDLAGEMRLMREQMNRGFAKLARALGASDDENGDEDEDEEMDD